MQLFISNMQLFCSVLYNIKGFFFLLCNLHIPKNPVILTVRQPDLGLHRTELEAGYPSGKKLQEEADHRAL